MSAYNIAILNKIREKRNLSMKVTDRVFTIREHEVEDPDSGECCAVYYYITKCVDGIEFIINGDEFYSERLYSTIHEGLADRVVNDACTLTETWDVTNILNHCLDLDIVTS